MHVSGLKEALEAKYEELGEAEAAMRKMTSEVCFVLILGYFYFGFFIYCLFWLDLAICYFTICWAVDSVLSLDFSFLGISIAV